MVADLVSLLEPETFEEGAPHALFDWLRENEPVHWNPGRPERERAVGMIEPEQRGFWVLTRHADVVAVSRNQELFSSERGTAINADMREQDLHMFRQQMIHMDPPRHTQLRGAINDFFKPRTIKRMDANVRELTREIVDAVAVKGSCDFVREVAAELPLLVLAELLGVPREDRQLLFDWTNRLMGLDDPEYGNPYDAQAALMELFQYCAALAHKRKEDPRDDLMSVLVHARIDDRELDFVEINMMFFLMVIAGNETTRNALSGGIEALCHFPDQKARLLEDRTLLKTAVEEIVRWHSPVMQFRRTATRDTEIGGQAIAENDKVVMYYGAANRDERVFERANQFDVGRHPNPHVGFGMGNHFCLGASLARSEMKIMLEEVLERIPDFELDGSVERLRSNFIHGIKRMPIRFTAARG
ncbi:MAG: cytochrome P450 [Myxococcota bacterium]|nr:cytochrome [Spirochaeta sp.]RPG05492.1 MAG: cytochrome P450 [Proteobacteria bacterium TMED72]